MIDTAFGLNGVQSGGQVANYAQERVRVMSVDTLRYRFHNRKEAGNPLKARQNSSEHGLEEAVSRALRDNLAPLQRTADETPPLSPEQQAERQRVQAEMLRLLQAAAKPEPLTIEARPAEEQAVRVPRKR